MTEQMGTPGSTADTSVNGGRAGAPKDKQCPFCHQSFTSSSLGRHLDLYIKEKNPKPADGIHDVDEIRKMRGGITRRQPRNSTSRREDSTPAGTPGAQERRSPPPDAEIGGKRSPNVRRESAATDTFNNNGKSNFYINQASWEATGVMNNIPVTRNGGSVQSWEGEDREGMRRGEGRNRSVSKQMLAKTTFDQKQKMMEALDNAKAAELALRELLGSVRAAKQRIDGPSIFDYDPLTLDFPALTLHCLSPPPTLYGSTPLPSQTSWSILPPDDQQYQALRSHFSAEFHRWRVSCAIATTIPRDDLSYPPSSQALFPTFEDPSEIAQRAETEAAELESKISEHLHAMFAHWTSLPLPKRTEIWTLELARSVGRKSEEVQRLKKEKELAQQETAHLKLQVDELSRLQHPREFRLVPPSTIPFDGKLMAEAGEFGLKYTAVGWNLLDRGLHLDTAIERAIGRWKGVVREARGAGGGLTAQRSLSGESSSAGQQQNQTPGQPPNHGGHHLSPTKPNQLSNSNSNPNSNINMNLNSTMTNGTADSDQDADADADADADMEEDDSFAEMNDAPLHSQRAPEAQMAQAANFRLTNGNGNGNERQGGSNGVSMEGVEGVSCVSGYVRIGA